MTEATRTRLQQLLAAAQERRLLPADATVPAQDARPWPVLLLVAVGAWLAAIPFIVVIGMLLGDFISRGVGTYLVGTLLLAAAVVVLRSRDLPVFVEQLAVPALLVGGGALAFGLSRDVQFQAACAILCAVALGLAVLVPSAWLRNLLGALAGTLAACVLLPRELRDFTAASFAFWFALHLALVAGLGALLLHERALAQGRQARGGAAVESIAAGWVAAMLVALAWWSGMTFLAGGVFGGGFAGELTSAAGHRGSGGAERATQLVSVVFAAAGCVLLGRRWPAVGAGAQQAAHPTQETQTTRKSWAARALPLAVGIVLVGLSWFLPALGAVLFALAGLAASQRWRLAGLAALAAAWIVGSFYYHLAWPLASKALVLVCAGGVLGALAWLAQHRAAHGGVAAPSFERRPALWLAGAALLTLLVANFGIWQKERLIAHGEKLFVPLAPVDPRSLMQGDYMRLNFQLPIGVEALPPSASARRPFVVARRDARGVAQMLRVTDGKAPLAPGEMHIELTPRDGRWTFVTDAWFFGEGDAQRWTQARFGEFRVDASGRALLVGLADEQLRGIPP